MSKKKQRQRELEEQQRLAERRAEAERYQQQPMFPGIAFGSVGGCVLPVTSGKVNAIQLPPIIQPVAMVPFSSQDAKRKVDDDDGFDDFDDFDDWD